MRKFLKNGVFGARELDVSLKIGRVAPLVFFATCFLRLEEAGAVILTYAVHLIQLDLTRRLSINCDDSRPSKTQTRPHERGSSDEIIDVARMSYANAQVTYQSPTGIAAAWRGMALREDTTDLLPGLSYPSLVIVGAEDVPSPPDEMRSMADKLPGSQFIELEDAGHMTPLEKPDVFKSAVETLLGMIKM